MDDLIEALQLFRQLAKGGKDVYAPTHCEHDALYIYPGVNPADVHEVDLATLERLGFIPSEFAEEGGWISYRFGSC